MDAISAQTHAVQQTESVVPGSVAATACISGPQNSSASNNRETICLWSGTTFIEKSIVYFPAYVKWVLF
jgi:hypothetical protein